MPRKIGGLEGRFRLYFSLSYSDSISKLAVVLLLKLNLFYFPKPNLSFPCCCNW